MVSRAVTSGFLTSFILPPRNIPNLTTLAPNLGIKEKIITNKGIKRQQHSPMIARREKICGNTPIKVSDVLKVLFLNSINEIVPITTKANWLVKNAAIGKDAAAPP